MKNSENCATIIASITKLINGLNTNQFYQLNEILTLNVSNEEKSSLLMSTFPSISSQLLTFSNQLSNYNLQIILSNHETKEVFLNTLANELGYGDISERANVYDPCIQYKHELAACLTGLALCVDAAAVGCVLATIGYLACFWGAANVCAGIAAGCAIVVDNRHPGCVPQGKINWSPFIFNYQPINNNQN